MSSYYVEQGKQIHLKPSKHFMAVRYQPSPMVPMAMAALTTHPGFGDKRKVIELPNDGVMLIPIQPAAPMKLLSAEITKSQVLRSLEAGSPGVFEQPDGSLMVPDGKVNADLSDRSPEQVDALLKQVGGRVAEAPTADFPFHVLEPQDGDAFRLANTLAEQKQVEAQPRFLKLLKQPRAFGSTYSRAATLSTGSDPLLPRQWGLNAIKADQCWSETLGSPDVRVAVIDSGVDLEHPDLKENLLDGYDDVDGDTRPQPEPDAHNAHGTACAGIIAAVGRNGIGVIGVAPRCKVLPVRLARVVGGYLYEKPGATARCILRSIRLGAWVISNSYGGPAPDLTVRKAIEEAVRSGRDGKGCVVVASAGNNNSAVKFPAAYPDVIAVAATRQDGDRCTPADWGLGQGSCFGPEVSVAAPGIDIWTTDIRGAAGYLPMPPPALGGGDYTDSFGGTSAACPFVAGVAALMLSINPQLTARDVRDILESTADKTGSAGYNNGRNDYLGHGRINALKAVHEVRRRLQQGHGSGIQANVASSGR